MSKRASDEERIINFFETGHIEAVKSVFNVVRGTMKRRITPPSAESKPVSHKKKKKTATTAAAVESAAVGSSG